MPRTRVIQTKDLPLPEVATAAVEALAAGELVILPTDTVYGLAARADDADAIARLFRAKSRPPDRPLPILLDSIDALQRVAASIDPLARALAEAFWPGPLTIVVPRGEVVPGWVTCGRDTVGVRMPADEVALAVLSRAPFLVAVTSANPSDHPTPGSAQQCAAFLAESPLVVLESGLRTGRASTVVEVRDGIIHVLRRGPIAEADLRRVQVAREE